MEEASDITDLVEVLNGRGITDPDRIRRLKSYLSATTLSSDQAITLAKIFDKCEAAAAIEGGVVICRALTSPDDVPTVLAAYKYAEDRTEILNKLA
mmetsp:Transcript_25710/g.43318  ORF Transcript_25710/g.43318 Transcript_25710/m.43318 type:complete len:96 (-) Transcript_25710:179-466(-)